MGLFVCHKCKCVENTATGHWWCRKKIEMFVWLPEHDGHKGEGLCSECMPIDFSDYSGKNGTGKWHGKFPKEHIDDFLKSESAKYYKLRKDGALDHI